MKKIYINEDNLSLLQEGKDRKQQARAKTKRVIDNHFNNSPMLDKPNEMTNGLPLRDYLEQAIMHDWFHARHRSDPKGYFICLEPMVANIALKLGWQQDQDDTVKLNRLTRIINYIDSLYQKNEIDIKSISLDSTFDELNAQFGSIIDELSKQENDEINNTDFGELNTDYQIIEDVDYEIANKYGAYSCSKSRLCYTSSEDTWDYFTNHGVNKVYLLLKNGWKGQEEVHSHSLLEQYPDSDAYDAYGLSMIFLFLSPEGELMGSNTRWNHNATYGNGRDVDRAFTKMDLSRIMGASFNNIFRGYSDEELKSKGINYVRFDEVQGLLDQGIDPEDIFDDIDDFYNGFAVVELNGKYNFILTDSRLLSPNQWFDDVGNFYNDFPVVELNGEYNYLKQDGTILSPNQWFDDVGNFYNGLAEVELNGKNYLLSKDGVLCDEIGNPIQESIKSKSKKIYINEEKLIILKESKEEVTFYGFFTQIKNFLKQLLTNPSTAEPSDILKSHGLNKDILITKLKKKGLLKSDENITEVPIDEAKDKNPLGKKLRAKYTIKYSVPRLDFEKKMHRLYSEIFESEWKVKSVLGNENEEIQKILDNDIDGAYKNRGGYKLSEMA